MNGKTRKLIWFQFHHYKDIQRRLEQLAAEGLILEACGTYFWTFRRDIPRTLHYTVTFFPEGSQFNPGITDNQQTYFDYAAASGWVFVAQLNKMQIFSSEAEKPVPFETDEAEKLKNIQKCMNRSTLPALLVMITMFSLNLALQISFIFQDPIRYLSQSPGLMSTAILILAILYFAYAIADYFLWCRRSRRSIALGGTCDETCGRIRRIADLSYLCFMLGCLLLMLILLATEHNWFLVAIALVQLPILTLLFLGAIRVLKKWKVSATRNRMLSFAVLALGSFAYVAMVVLLISRFPLPMGGRSDYRTVTWEVTSTHSYDYQLYSDELPLTCQDLYGPDTYEFYSYEKQEDRSVFLTHSTYRQDTLPAKDAPPRLSYEVITPHVGFAARLAKQALLAQPEWQPEWSFRPIDGTPFGAAEAYQEYCLERPSGTYLFFLEDRFVKLNLEEPATEAQNAVIRALLLS